MADNDDEGVFLIDRISIAKFAGKIGFNRNAGQLFDHVFSGCTGMIGRAAGNDGYFPEIFNLLVGHTDFAQIDFILVNAGRNRVTDSLWLLVDFLEHKVFVATFFGSVDIPVDGDGLFFNRFAVNIAEARVLIGKADDFFIFHIINCPGILQDGGNVGGNEFSGIVYANDQRAVLAGGVDVMRMI